MIAVILAISNFQLVGCLELQWYHSAEAEWPHGWKELLDKNIQFEQVDAEFDAKMAEDYVAHFNPTTKQ